jgi:hypothetical protein
MENNGRANAMETLKAKVLEFKERATPQSWILVALALVIAVPISGGTLALGSFLLDAPLAAILLVLVGVVGYTFIIYGFIYNFLMTLDRTYAAKPVHEEDGE